jgi:hypothetical protein
MIILALDALDKKMVEKFNCKNLMQLEYGQTDLGGFELERTVVLWASFLTGKNMETAIPIKGQWEFKLSKNETFFKFFDIVKTVDVPAFSLKLDNHKREHKLLAGYFKHENKIEDFDKIVWKNHEENKKDFLTIIKNSVNKKTNSKIVMGYFDLADAIGHLSFGIEEKMKEVYRDLESLAIDIKKISNKTNETILTISDHGMKPVGRFGDHTKNGFYSCNKNLSLETPRITDFYKTIKNQ